MLTYYKFHILLYASVSVKKKRLRLSYQKNVSGYASSFMQFEGLNKIFFYIRIYWFLLTLPVPLCIQHSPLASGYSIRPLGMATCYCCQLNCLLFAKSCESDFIQKGKDFFAYNYLFRYVQIGTEVVSKV